MERAVLEELVNLGMTQRAIAAACETSQTNVRHWLRRHNLTTVKPPSREPIQEHSLTQPVSPPAPPMRPADSNAQSARTESRVLAALTKAGYPCYVPFGVGKADLIIETGQGLKTVQCKTGNVVNDGAVLRFKSSTGNRAGKRIGYRGIIDFFAVAAPDLPGIYLVPVDMMGETEVYLRLKPPMNWQTRRINMAEEFLVPNSRLL